MKKNSKVIVHLKEGTTLPLGLPCILLEDSISFIIVKNNVELMIPWCNIDYIEEDISVENVHESRTADKEAV